LWTDNPLAKLLIAGLDQIADAPQLFLCQKAAAAQLDSLDSLKHGAAFTVSRSGANSRLQPGFSERFGSLAGHPPTAEAAATYDAVSLVLAALREAGPNRARLRDQLARTHDFAGLSGGVTFDGAGNNLAPDRVVAVPLAVDRASTAGH